jgi:hypothetical protein
MKHPLRTSILLWLTSLLVLALAYALPNFGLPLWVFGPLLGWLLTFGLPTTLAFHGLAALWSSLPLGLFFGAAAATALVLHFLATLFWLRLRLRRARELRS